MADSPESRRSGRPGRHEARYTYHPVEVALAGYSGAGKTTLAARLLRHWGDRYRVGYMKHDAHRFEMDRPGKDTFEAAAAGAAVVAINDPHHHAHISTRPFGALDRAAAFTHVDFVLAEGFKHSGLPKLLLLDPDGRAWRAHAEGAFPNVLALVGPAPTAPAFAPTTPAPDAPVRSAAAPPSDLPYFHRDDVAAIAAFVEAHVLPRPAPLYGLVLAGGESRRMGRDKWALDYTGEPQAQRTARLLGAVCERVSLSVRTDQPERRIPGVPVIADAFPPWGPVTGLLSAMEAHPGAAWLVAACDLPFLDRPTLDALVAARHPLRVATAYRSALDGLPEPLCAIWEPRARAPLLAAAGLGRTCPRRVLQESSSHLVDLTDPRALANANTPDEYAAARAALAHSHAR